MKVSVIIPTYNEEKVIGECLTSLGAQTISNFEVILVDDGSSDTTLIKARELKIRNYELRIFHQKHKGPGSARNLGAKKAKGKILVFVDADMTFDKHFLKELVEPIAEGYVKGTFSKNEYVENWENVWAKCWNINQNWEEGRRHPEKYPDTQKVFRAILKSEFGRVGGFDKGGHYTDDYLSEKLGYMAKAVSGAKFYHKNPDNLKDVFTQAKWSAKREYKFGFVGILYSLLRSSLPISIFVGATKALLNGIPEFLIFKIVYDYATFFGILEMVLVHKSTK